MIVFIAAVIFVVLLGLVAYFAITDQIERTLRFEEGIRKGLKEAKDGKLKPYKRGALGGKK